MTSTRSVLVAPLGLGAVVLAAAPAVASLLGVDSLRGWLGLTQAAGVVVRCAVLCYATFVAAGAIARAPVTSTRGFLARAVAAVLALAGVALLGAVVWSSPARAADAQEWVLLFACPSATVMGVVGATIVVMLGKGMASSPHSGVVRAACTLAVVAALAYALMRWAGVPALPRVLLPVSVAVVVAVLLVALALDGTRRPLARAPAGVVAGAIVIFLAAA